MEKINETHICVLKKDGELIKVDTQELTFEFNGALSVLKAMCDNENRKRYELDEYIRNSSLKCLLQSFNYCEYMQLAYQKPVKYELIDYLTYKAKEDEYVKSLEENSKRNGYKKIDLDKELKLFHANEKLNVFSRIKTQVSAYLLDLKYKSLPSNRDILAFSHQKIGWSLPEFNLGNDFKVVFKTNFGYGQSSYFYTNISYKGIDFLLYADWIKYQKANKIEIVQYTRRNLLENSSWIQTMNFTADLYNDSIKEPVAFIDKWILNECSEMVDGLEFLLNKDERYELVESFFHPENKIILMGLELIIFKGERISGSLSFLDRIKELGTISDKVEGFIRRIMDCNLSIYPQLNREVENLQKLIDQNEIDLGALEIRFNKAKEEKEKLDDLYNLLFIKTKESYRDVSIGQWELKKICDKLFSEGYPNANQIFKEYGIVKDQYNTLVQKIQSQKGMKSQLAEYARVIEVHFDSIGVSVLNIA